MHVQSLYWLCGKMYRHYTGHDHIYNYIEIDKYTEQILKRSDIDKELERLKHINQLGVITKFYPLARHSKFEHAIGLYHLSNLSEKHFSLSNRADIQPKNLKLAAILHGIGHLPYTYATEKAFMYLYESNENISSEIDDIVDQILEYLKIKPKSNKGRNLKVFLKNSNHFELNRWISAYKVLKMDDLQEKNQVIRYIIDPEKQGYKLLRDLDKIDFTLRDAFYINWFIIQLNLTPFFKSLKLQENGELKQKELQIIKSFHDALKEKVYFEPRVIALENIFARLMAKYINNKEESVESFKKYNDQTIDNKLNGLSYRLYYDDLKLEDIIKYIEDDTIEHVYSSKYLSSKEEDICKLERKIVRKKDVISIPETTGIFLSVKKDNEDISDQYNLYNFYNLDLFWYSKSGDPKHVLNTIRQIERGLPFREYPNIYKSHKEQILAFIFGNKIKSKFKLEKYITKDLKEAVSSFPIEGFFHNFSHGYPQLADEFDKIMNTIETIEEISNERRQEIQYDFLQAYSVRNLLYTPEIFSRDFLKKIETELSQKQHREKWAEAREEYDSFLRTVIEQKEKNNSSWTLPCVNFTENDSGEIDIVTLEFKNIYSRPLITMEEVSKSKSPSKKEISRKKLGEFDRKIKDRFHNKIYTKGKFNGEKLFGQK